MEIQVNAIIAAFKAGLLTLQEAIQAVKAVLGLS